MSWYDDYGYDWNDHRVPVEPFHMDFDRVVTTTEKAVLYGMHQYIFWVPKSVHSIRQAPDTETGQLGEILVEGWANITRNRDNSYSPHGKLHVGKLTAIEQDVVDEALGDTL